MVGIRQYLILKKCYSKGFIDVSDVKKIYDLPNNYRPKYSDVKRKQQKPLLILEKLEAYGWLKRVNLYRFKLTDEGEKIIDKDGVKE